MAKYDEFQEVAKDLINEHHGIKKTAKHSSDHEVTTVASSSTTANSLAAPRTNNNVITHHASQSEIGSSISKDTFRPPKVTVKKEPI